MKIVWSFICVALWFAVAGCGGSKTSYERSLEVKSAADVVLRGGKIITVDGGFAIKQALAIRDGRFVAVGSDGEIRDYIGARTQVIDLAGRTVIPGLIDAHIHATAAGMSWDQDLHWQTNRTLADGLRQITAAAKGRTAGTWIVVGGGWVPTQFAEQRFPSRAELDASAPNHPVYVQYLRQGALLNTAALKLLGITRQSADPAGGRIDRSPTTGEPTGWLQGVGGWRMAYEKIPRPSLAEARQSLRNCFRELNRLGITSIGDIHTGAVNFAHRRLLADMARTGELSLRVNYYIAPNDSGDELEQLKRGAAELVHLGNHELFRFAGFAETLVRGLGEGDGVSDPNGIQFSIQAKEKFRALLGYFAANGYGFHLNAARDGNARQLLDLIEPVHRATPLVRQRMVFAHLEDASAETLARIKTLGAGIAVQGRLALTGERAVELWGEAKARRAPPLRAILNSGVPVGVGSAGFQSANFAPMVTLSWLTTGRTLAGSPIRVAGENLTRAEALRLHTLGSAWLTGEQERKGSIEAGKLADLAVLSGDYLTVGDEQLRSLTSLLTMIGGRIVYAAGPYAQLAAQ